MIKTLIRAVAYTTLSLLLLVALTVTAIWLKPDLVFRPTLAKKVANFLTTKGLSLTWTSLEMEALSPSFWKKQIRTKAEHFCYRDPQTDLCIQTLALDVDFDFHSWPPQLTLSQIKLLGTEGAYRQPEPERKVAEKKKSSSNSFFSGIRIQDGRVQVNHLTYSAPQLVVQTSVDLLLKGTPKGTKATGHFQTEVWQNQDRSEGRGTLSLESKDTPWSGPYEGKGSINARLANQQSVDLNLDLAPESGAFFRYKVSANYSKQKRRIGFVSATGVTDFKDIRGSLEAKLAQTSIRDAGITLTHCQFSAHFESKTGPLGATLHCPGQVTAPFRKLGEGPRETGTKILPIDLEASITSENKTGSKLLSGEAQLIFVPSPRTLAASEPPNGLVLASVRASYEQPENHAPVFATEGSFQVPNFQQLVTFLYPTPWAIPAPLNIFEGTLALNWGNQEKNSQDKARIPVTLQTRLHSSTQRASLDGQGEIVFNRAPNGARRPHFNFKLMLSDLSLELPYMTFSAPPRLIPDKRIKLTSEVRSSVKKESFSYRIEVDTPDSHPLTLKSNLAKQKIPLSLHLHIDSKQGMGGAVRLEPFDVDLFRRKASIRRLDLKINPDPEKTEVNGEIRVTYTDYTINILLLGLLNRPQIKFQSDPPLPEDKVLAVLLFGKDPTAMASTSSLGDKNQKTGNDAKSKGASTKTAQASKSKSEPGASDPELDENQASSVGSTQAAIADNAISLVSMYFLASTPIESIGYNPMTGMFSAKVRLADGTSLNVGTDMKDLNQIGIRKRLGEHWTIVTSLQQRPLEAVQTTVTALLEWTKAY